MDWLNATFAAPVCSVEALVALLGRMLGRPVSAQQGPGMLGFAERVDLSARVGSKSVPIGCIAMGGASQMGRWLLQFTGAGCGLVTDWEGLQDLLESLDAKLTRVDLAVDFLHGEYSVDDAIDWHAIGGFTGRGRAPATSVAGDWLGGLSGRTFYVGKRENGKCLRVYEKGRQLGDSASEWVRFEVQLGSRDRVIPFDVLTRRDEFFAGTYPAMRQLVDAAAEAVPTQQTAGVTTLGHLLYHLKRCYGKLVDTLSAEVGTDSAALVQEVRVIGLPKRVNPSSVAAGLEWAQVLAQLKGKK